MIYLAYALLAINIIYAIRAIWVAAGSGWKCEIFHAPPDAPLVSILVPARNEERSIRDCLESLLAQDYPNFEVIVIDDRSEDLTAAIVQNIADRDPRVRLVHGTPLPDGWVGKCWALDQGVKHARGEWLLFTDADTVHEPLATASAVYYARKRELGALSLLPDQVLKTLAERAFMPSIIWTIAFALGPIEDIHDASKVENALFNGQYLIVRRDAYFGVGGHAAVKNEVAEDYELALAFKRDGRYPIALVGANGLVRTRMYRAAGEIWDGFSKNFALGVRGKPGLALVGLAFLLCVTPLPELAAVAAAVLGAWHAVAVCVLTVAISVGTTEIAMRRMRFPLGSALWSPIGGCGAAIIFTNSLIRHSAGLGVTWRGRTYGQSEVFRPKP